MWPVDWFNEMHAVHSFSWLHGLFGRPGVEPLAAKPQAMELSSDRPSSIRHGHQVSGGAVHH